MLHSTKLAKYYSRTSFQYLSSRRSSNSSIRAAARCFSSPSSASDDNGEPLRNEAATAATIIQGPSLLTNTGYSRPSPSLFILPGLRSLPFWTAPHSRSPEENNNNNRTVRVAFNDPTVSKIVQHLEDNYERIRSEYMSAVLGINSGTLPSSSEEDETRSFKSPLQPDYDLNTSGTEHGNTTAGQGQSLHEGQWDWHSYMQSGIKSPEFKSHCPITAQVVDDIGTQHLFQNNPFAFCFYSTLSGNSRIKSHSGPMNLRLRIHLPLIVPSITTVSTKDDNNNAGKPSRKIACGIRVGTQLREWIPGKAIVLDDSFDHEVWNDTEEHRVLLLIDIWHPDVIPEERRRIEEMFAFAKDKGWLGKK